MYYCLQALVRIRICTSIRNGIRQAGYARYWRIITQSICTPAWRERGGVDECEVRNDHPVLGHLIWPLSPMIACRDREVAIEVNIKLHIDDGCSKPIWLFYATWFILILLDICAQNFFILKSARFIIPSSARDLSMVNCSLLRRWTRTGGILLASILILFLCT